MPHPNYNQGRGRGRHQHSESTRYDERRVTQVPPLHATPSPPYQSASLCTSSASSEPYVSPRDSDKDGDDSVKEERQQRSPLRHPSTTTSTDFGREFGSSCRTGESTALGEPGGAAAAGSSLTTPPPLGNTTHPTTNITAAAATAAQAPGSPHLSVDTTTPTASAPPPLHTHFQYIHSFDYRRRLAAKMRALYGSETVPVIVEPAESHLRPSSPASAAYKSKRLAAETRHRGVDLGRGLLARLGIAGTTNTTATGAALPPSAVAALSSPSTRSTVKCVLPSRKSVAEIILTLRDRLALDSCQSIFLSVGESDALVPGNSLLGDLYQRYQHPDGFLYLSYLLENTFG